MNQGRLIVEFGPNVSLHQARHDVAGCASASSVIRRQPVMLLVLPRATLNSRQAEQRCGRAPGVVHVEWNQKRQLR